MINASRKQPETVVQARDITDVSLNVTTRMIACAICKAIYTPSPSHPSHRQLVMAPNIVLESAFMGMCHFCFRCRRAACPECWDEVHGICASCVREAGLLFRKPTQSLVNDIVSIPRLENAEQDEQATPALICIQHGRFSQKPSLSPRSSRTSHAVQVATGRHHPAQEQSISQLPSAPTLPAIKPVYIRLNEHEHKHVSPAQRVLRDIERVLNIVLLVMLLAIATAVILAERSPNANAQIMHLLHVDIHAEIAYLMHVVSQLNW